MAQLEGFSNVTKLSDDLLKKNFCLGQDLAVSLYASKDNFNFKTSVKQASGPDTTSSSTYFQYKGENLAIKQEFSGSYVEGSNLESLGKLKTTAEYTLESRPYLKGKLELDSGAGYQKNTLSAEVTKANYRYKVGFSDDAVFKFSGVYGKSEIGAGVELTYDLGPVRFTQYNAAFWVNRNNWKGTLKHESSNTREYELGNLVGSLYLRSFYKCSVGVRGLLNLSNATRSLSLAAENRLDRNNLIKARLNTEANLALALRSRVSNLVQLTAAMEFKPLSKQSDVHYGLRIKINQ